MKLARMLGVIMPALLLLAGCGAIGDDSGLSGPLDLPTTVTTADKFVPGLPKGYQCPLVPNGFDPAGSIYRVNRKGTFYRVKNFNKDPVVEAGRKSDIRIANYVLSDKQKSTAGLSINLLKYALPGLSANASGDLNREVSVDITVKDIRGEVIYDEAADHVITWFRKNIRPRPGSKYFLVRETVRAGSVGYRLKSKDLSKFGGKAEMEKIASGKADVTVRDNAGDLEIEQTFSPRIPVCIKSAEIVIDPSRTANQGVSLKSTDDTSAPEIRSVGLD